MRPYRSLTQTSEKGCRCSFLPLSHADEREGLQIYPISSHQQDEREGLQMRREVDDGVLLVRLGDFPQQMRPYRSSSNTTFYAGTHSQPVNPEVYP